MKNLLFALAAVALVSNQAYANWTCTRDEDGLKEK